MARPTLEIRELRVGIDGREIVKGLDLTVRGGEVHAIMGPNGTGKSTLASALMGHPTYEVLGGTATLDGENLLEMGVDERARAGLFLAMQYPAEISGVSTANFLRTAVNARRGESDPMPVLKFHRQLKEKMERLSIDPAFAERYVNEGFSGGEKKRNEILQMSILQPRIAILDEIDSGLDIDAVKIVAQGVNDMLSEDFGVLIITHYQRILNYIRPTNVHVMMQGRIVRSGGPELAEQLEARGYEWLREELGIEEPLSQEA